MLVTTGCDRYWRLLISRVRRSWYTTSLVLILLHTVAKQGNTLAVKDGVAGIGSEE